MCAFLISVSLEKTVFVVENLMPTGIGQALNNEFCNLRARITPSM
jgi:hypothetical protein